MNKAEPLVRLTTQGKGSYSWIVERDGKPIGFVFRTGSLPSCLRWWAQPLNESAITPSCRTRTLAVQKLLSAC